MMDIPLADAGHIGGHTAHLVLATAFAGKGIAYPAFHGVVEEKRERVEPWRRTGGLAGSVSWPGWRPAGGRGKVAGEPGSSDHARPETGLGAEDGGGALDDGQVQLRRGRI